MKIKFYETKSHIQIPVGWRRLSYKEISRRGDFVANLCKLVWNPINRKEIGWKSGASGDYVIRNSELEKNNDDKLKILALSLTNGGHPITLKLIDLRYNPSNKILSARVINALLRSNIKTVGEILLYSESDLLRFLAIGTKGLSEIKTFLCIWELQLKKNIQ